MSTTFQMTHAKKAIKIKKLKDEIKILEQELKHLRDEHDDYTDAEHELFKSYTHILLCKQYYSKDYCYKSMINNINYYDDWFTHFNRYKKEELKKFINQYKPIEIKSGKTKKQLIMDIFEWWFGIHPSRYHEVWTKYF
jgi:hypothetical protein